MMTERFQEILDKLNQLKKIDRNMQIFGSISHKYISKKIPQQELGNFESEHNIKLPSELKDFLMYIGFGAGPDYGIYSPSQMFKEYEEWVSCLNDNSTLASQCDLTNLDALDLIQKKQKMPMDFHYKRLTNANGILPIQTEGCTYYSYIVLNGEQYNKIWAVDINEFNTLPAGIVTEFGFLDWYETWLNKSLADLTSSGKNAIANNQNGKKTNLGGSNYLVKRWFYA